MALQTLFENDDFDVMILALLAKIKRLEREVKELAMLRRTVIGGGMSKAFADSSYLRLDGSRAMVGDLDLDTGNYLKFSDVRLGRENATTLKIMDATETYYKNLKLGMIVGEQFYSWANIMSYDSWASTTSIQRFRGWTPQQTALQITSSATGCFADIPRAGDITMLTGKILSGLGDVRAPNLPLADPSDGLSKLWNNGGVVTVGT